MTGTDILIACGVAIYMGAVFWIVTKLTPHEPPKLPPDLEDRRAKK